MSLAYLILAHKSPEQVERLFRAIHHSDDYFVLHFDRRAEVRLHELGRTLTRKYPNVTVLPPRAILWGGAIMTEVQIAAMQCALDRSSTWQHFINLTGQDFPLKSREEILAKLTPRAGTSFVSWFDPLQGNLWQNARARLNHYYFDSPGLTRILQIPGIGHRLGRLFGWTNQLPHMPFYRRRWPGFFRYYGGANHVILNREACVYLNNDARARRIRHWLRHAAHANEITFQSVLLNSPLAPTLVNAHFRDIIFPSPNSPHPTTVTATDLPRLAASEAFFARKFDPVKSAPVMEALEKKIQFHEAGSS
jgi:hypothetical protein